MDEVGYSGQILPDESPDPAGLAVHHLVVGAADVASGGAIISLNLWFILPRGIFCGELWAFSTNWHSRQHILNGGIRIH
jgi:hypothetical protein